MKTLDCITIPETTCVGLNLTRSFAELRIASLTRSKHVALLCECLVHCHDIPVISEHRDR